MAGKAILIIGDGLGDRPVKELGNRTPLEAANRPNMNRMAAEGECGIMDPIAVGVRAGSDTSHLAILGYDPYKYYTGRGPFEAAGIGMDVKKGDVAFRCNFTTVEPDFTVTDRRAGRITEGTDQLAAAINGMQIEDVTVLFKESVAHRGALVLRGPGLGADITDTDPHVEGAKVHDALAVNKDDAASAKTARIVNEFVKKSFEILNDHPVNKDRSAKGLPPANVILPRGGGLGPNLESFMDEYKLSAACVAETGLINGVAKYVGMDIITVPGATGGLDSDVMALGKGIIDALKDHDFVLCNVKGGDIGGHDGKADAKVKLIETMDEMIGYVLSNAPEGTYVVLTADHSTPVVYKDHSGDPVPICVWGPEVRTDKVEAFDERSVIAGGIHRIRGIDVMKIITQYLGTQEKFGA